MPAVVCVTAKVKGCLLLGSLNTVSFSPRVNTLHTSRRMGILSTLLCLLLTVHSVNALMCYVCGSVTSNDECNKNSQECQAPFDTCMTTVVTLGSVKGIAKYCSISKICAAGASTASLDSNGNGAQVSCCSGRLCNYSGAATVKLHTWLLALPLLITLLIKQHI
ncbi:lymphocyte antigen 6E-like [Xyrauchen texanus]|uniref:lymphocyte antigen 6E-like n=1 Tax=Xyrauchen texanus TaxID=154827 RepID=UPI0022429B83|nr:lymphocyte antigen 6E-like [Xyrauchen texanus]